jgi:hypothetical protein
MKKQAITNSAPQGPVDLYKQHQVHGEAESYMRQQFVDERAPAIAGTINTAQEPIESEAYRYVDPYTLEVISNLFPAPTNGIDFLARILRHAQIVQDVLPGLEEVGDFVAVISTRTIRVLAQSIHMAYDTTHKYVATFCALGLLHKYKHDKQRQLVFPLKRYTPPSNLQALERLIAQSRPKLQQFARGVKKRFLRLKLGHSEMTEGPAPLPTHDNNFLKTLFAPMVNLLHTEGIDITLGQHIAHRLINEVIGKILPAPLESTAQNSKDRLPSAKKTTQGGLCADTSAEQKTIQHKKSSTKAKNLPPEQKVYPTQEQESYDPMLDLLALYDELLANELTDWSQSSLPRWFFEELYENLLASYDTLKARKLTGNIQDYAWEAIESSTIRKLAASYGYDFAALYDFIQYCTFRTDEYSPRPLRLEESTHAEMGVDFSVNQQKKESTLDIQIVDSVADPTKEEATLTAKVVDSCADAPRKESTVRIKTVDPKNSKQSKKSTLTQTTVDSFLCTETEESTHLTPTVDSSASELEQKYALLAKLDMTEEEINSEMGKRLLAESVEELLGCVENYLRFKKIDEEIEAEKIAKLRIPLDLNEKYYSEEFNALLRKRNVIILLNNIYNNITLRKELKIFFAEIFDTKRVKQADDWFKVVDECTAEQLCAGFIDTVVLLHSPTSKPIEKPGGFFNTRCRTLKENGLPADTLKRLDRYGEMTYVELVEAMKDLLERR